jgi:hypothetical protein
MEAPTTLRSAPSSILTCLLACAALAVPGLAQEETSADTANATTDVDARTLDRRRLLTLEEALVLRARTRFAEGRWERRDGSDWVPVQGRVTRDRLEREVVAEARKMGAQVGKKEQAKRVALARWMVGQGLYAEATVELDRVLGKSPEDARALGLIRDVRIPIDLPATDLISTVKALVIAGAGGTPAKREIAVRRLAEMEGRIDLRQLVTAELAGRQQGRRAFMTLVARRLYPGEFMHELSSRAILDGVARVREGAAFALRDANNVAVLGPPINALASTFPNVRANAAEALGNIGHLAAVQPLVTHLASMQSSGSSTGTRANLFLGVQLAYVMDYDVEIAQAASIADPVVAVQASGVVFDVRTVVQMTKYVEQRAIMSSLKQLTGANPGREPQSWLDWWEANGKDWQSLDHARKPRTSQR